MKIKHHATDKAYKFMYKRLNAKFHHYFYAEYGELVFIDTEIPETGQRRDMTVKVDEKVIRNTEFLSRPLYDDKLNAMYDYHESLKCDKNNEGLTVRSGLISIANPKQGKNKIEIDGNIIFALDIIFTKDKNGWEVLSNLIYKLITQEELSDDEAIDLLILPDMNIELPIKALMSIICFLIVNLNISDDNFKEDLIVCEIEVLKRFFTGNELSEMVAMLKYKTENPEVRRIVERYGPGFDVIYFDGKDDAKLESATNLLNEGIDEEIISRCIGLSIDQIRELKRKL